MTKLLYIPNSCYVLFPTANGLTAIYEKAGWYSSHPPEEIIEFLCKPGNSFTLKTRSGIPFNVTLDPSEFEIVYD